MMSRRRIASAILAGSVALAAGSASAAPTPGVVRTPFQLELTPVSAQALLSGVESFRSPTGSASTTLADIQLTDPYNVAISGIHLNVAYEFGTPTAAGGLSDWSVATKNVSGDVVVDSVNAHGTIVKDSPGRHLVITYDATCRNVHLRLAPGSTQATAKVSTSLRNGKPTVTLTDFSANWAPASWSVDAMTCSGAGGFDTLVAQGVEQRLRTIDPFLPQIRDQIQAQLTKTADTTPLAWNLNAATVAGFTGTTLTLRPNDLQPLTGGGAVLEGEAEFTFSNLKHPETCGSDVSASLPSTAGRADDSLLVPWDAIRALIGCAYANDSIRYKWSSNDFAAFQQLRSSTLERMVAWPDLASFADTDVFWFQVYPLGGVPTLGALSSSSAGELDFNLSGPAVVSTYAPYQGKPAFYVDFNGNVNGKARLTVKNGALAYRQSMSGLNLNPYWDPAYVARNHPDETLATDTIASHFKTFLAGTGLKYTLPNWEKSQAFRLMIQTANEESGNVRAGLKIIDLRSSTRRKR